MNHQLIESALGAHAAILRFSGGCIGRYYHVTQKMGGDMRKFALAHDKSNYICRTLSVEILAIEFFDLRIIHDKDGNFSIRKVQGA